MRAAQVGADAPTTVDVSPVLVTTLQGLLQTKGESSPVTIPNYPLPDGRTAVATLQAFPLWHDNAEITVLSGTKQLGSGRPRLTTQLLGRINDDRVTTVQLRQTETGMTGFVIHDGRPQRHAFAASRVTFYPLAAEPADPTLGRTVCALDQTPGKGVIGTPPPPTGPPGETVPEYLATLDVVEPPSVSDALGAFCCVGAPGGQSLKFFDVAVETDDELMVRLHSSLAIQAHVTDVIAAVNAIYWDGGTGVIFRLRWFHIYQARSGASADPFELPGFMVNGNSFARVEALRDLWNNNPDRVAKTRINRDIGLLISGTNLGGSSIFHPSECVVNGQSNGQWCSLSNPCSAGTCQWVGEPLCRKDKAYAAVSFYAYLLDPVEAQINDTAHELGHLFGAEHAHCTDTRIPASVPPLDPIDQCRSGGASMRGESCWTGTTQPPPNNTDTIMSICASQRELSDRGIYIHRGLVFHPRSAEIIHDASQNGTCGKPATVVMMQNGQRIPNLGSTSVAGRFYFAIDVPAGQNQLEIDTQGTGELMLYARYGTLPTNWGTLKSEVPGTANQRIVVTAPRAGRWYILMFGWNPFMGVELHAEHQ